MGISGIFPGFVPKRFPATPKPDCKHQTRGNNGIFMGTFGIFPGFIPFFLALATTNPGFKCQTQGKNGNFMGILGIFPGSCLSYSTPNPGFKDKEITGFLWEFLTFSKVLSSCHPKI